MKKYLFILTLTGSVAMQAQTKTILKKDNVECAYPRLSKDGKRVLYQCNESGKWQIYICDVNGKNQRRLTNDGFNNNFPDWSADNKWIAFVSDRDGNEELYIVNTDGTGLTRITNSPSRDIHPYFSPDGKYILFNSDRGGDQFDVYRYTIATKKTERLTNTADNETCARYAPNMTDIVLLKNSMVADDVYILHTANFLSDNVTRTPHAMHGWPMFSADGKWVYYSSMEKGTYSLYRVKADGTGKQQLTHAKAGEEHARVNVSADGKFMIYNVKAGATISIVREQLP